jgi:glycosyltransferase involved in cell wall biosynthesis
MELFTLTTIELLLLALAGLLLLIQLAYYLLVYARTYLHGRAVKRHKTPVNKELPPLSVIVTANDETESLRRNLTSILEQDYPEFEVIVINNGSSSESADYLTLMAEKYPNLYHSFVPDSSRYISRKKLSVMLGIKASKYDWLVLTEANCCPLSNQWLQTLARNFTSRAEIVLGYSGFEHRKGWLHKQIAFDNLFLSMRYMGCALARKPYMGIGRNLAYRKELFYRHKGFSEHLNLKRGDDDLFVNSVATAANTRVETDSQAAVHTTLLPHKKGWYEEKIGYMATARCYHGMGRYLMGGETTTRLLFYAAWIAACVVGMITGNVKVAGAAVAFFLLRYVVQCIVVNLTAKSVGEQRRYYFSLPLFDLLQPLWSLRWKLSCMFRHKEEFLRK